MPIRYVSFVIVLDGILEGIVEEAKQQVSLLVLASWS
jgi:hypothetical protein